LSIIRRNAITESYFNNSNQQLNFMLLLKTIKLRILVVAVVLFYNGMLSGQALVFNESIQRISSRPGQRYFEFSFSFVNKGNEVVKINDVQLSCGCSSYEMKKDAYASGESGVIKVKTDTLGQAKIAYVGVVLETDEKDGLYKLQGFITRPENITITPRMLRWQLGDEMREKRFLVSLSSRDINTESLAIRNVIVNKDYFFVRVVTAKDGKSCFVYVCPKQKVTCADMIKIVTSPEGPPEGLSVIAYVSEKRVHL